MQLRNRRTKEEIKFYQGDKIHSFFAGVKHKTQTQEDFFHDFLQDFKERIVNFPKKIQKQLLNQVINAWKQYGKQLEQAFNNNDLQALFEKLHTQPQKMEWQEPSFLKTMTTALLQAKLGPLAYVLTPMMLSATSAAAQEVMWVPHEGQPGDGMDLCKNILFGCVQGYATNGTDAAWKIGNPQYNRILSEVSHDSSGSAREQLRTCFDADALGNVVTHTLNNADKNGPTADCLAQAPDWQGWGLTARTTNVPSMTCPSLQNNIASEVQSCQSYLGQAAQAGKIIGIALGATAGAVILCVGSYMLYQKCRGRSIDCDQAMHNIC